MRPVLGEIYWRRKTHPDIFDRPTGIGDLREGGVGIIDVVTVKGNA